MIIKKNEASTAEGRRGKKIKYNCCVTLTPADTYAHMRFTQKRKKVRSGVRKYCWMYNTILYDKTTSETQEKKSYILYNTGMVTLHILWLRLVCLRGCVPQTYRSMIPGYILNILQQNKTAM